MDFRYLAVSSVVNLLNYTNFWNCSSGRGLITIIAYCEEDHSNLVNCTNFLDCSSGRGMITSTISTKLLNQKFHTNCKGQLISKANFKVFI